LPGSYDEATGEPYFAVYVGKAMRCRTRGCGSPSGMAPATASS